MRITIDGEDDATYDCEAGRGKGQAPRSNVRRHIWEGKTVAQK